MGTKPTSTKAGLTIAQLKAAGSDKVFQRRPAVVARTVPPSRDFYARFKQGIEWSSPGWDRLARSTRDLKDRYLLRGADEEGRVGKARVRCPCLKVRQLPMRPPSMPLPVHGRLAMSGQQHPVLSYLFVQRLAHLVHRRGRYARAL